MTRNIFLVIYPAYPFKAHWALWVPSVGNKDIGTIIHVEGDVRSGFKHDFKRNYDLIHTRRTHRLILLSEVHGQNVHDTPSGGVLSNDTTPRDNVEQISLSITAPGPSMRPTASNTPPAQRVAFSDCQWWLTQVVAKLVQQNILDATADTKVQNAPKN